MLQERSVNSVPNTGAGRGAETTFAIGNEAAEMEPASLSTFPGRRQLLHPQLTRPAPYKSFTSLFFSCNKTSIS
jgi:hypothetical protein